MFFGVSLEWPPLSSPLLNRVPNGQPSRVQVNNWARHTHANRDYGKFSIMIRR
jgi:hypothetical protein